MTLTPSMTRYHWTAGVYDLVSMEKLLYRPGRVAAIQGLQLNPGDRVLDVGCGTGLNLPQLVSAIGPTGEVVGLDSSKSMLAAARRRVRKQGWSNVTLIQGDAAKVDLLLTGKFDAILFTYSLSIIGEWQVAWGKALALLDSGGRAAVVDTASTTGPWKLLSPLANLAMLMGGVEPARQVWRQLLSDAADPRHLELRGGHVQVAIGTKPPSEASKHVSSDPVVNTDAMVWESDPIDPPDGVAWDLVVVGGGTAGLVAAQTAAGFGASVLLVERDRIGGDCLWTGCVPSKALLTAAHAAHDARSAGRYGIRVEAVTVDFPAVMTHVREAIATIEPVDSPTAMRAAGVSAVQGTAKFIGRNTATIDGQPVRFRQAVVATGAGPVIPPIPGLMAAGPLTNESIFDLTELPVRLLVLGGGSIGCELGQAFARLGSQVTIIEAAPRLLVREDADAAELVTAALIDDKALVRVGVAVTQVRADGPGWMAVLDNGDEIGFDRVLVAVGRHPRTSSLGLDAARVKLDDDGFIRVDGRLRTTNPRIWAAGDLTGHPQFTHTAGVHGSLAASNAVLGLRRRVEPDNVPRVTFTQPEIASVGISLEQARETALRVRTINHDEIDRAIAEQETAGFSRLIVDAKDKVVGATIVGPRAGESIAEVVLAAGQGISARAIGATQHAYPTYGDGVWKSGIAQIQSQLRRGITGRVIPLLVKLRRATLMLR